MIERVSGWTFGYD
jgi:hypothetical protein